MFRRCISRHAVKYAEANQNMPVLTKEEVNKSMVHVRQSDLLADYFSYLATTGKVHFHAPVHITIRKNGLRGLTLNPNAKIQRNQPIFTVPLTSAITPENVFDVMPQQCGLKRLTRDMIVPHFANSEMDSMADNVILGYATAAVSMKYDKVDRPELPKAFIRSTEGHIPWLRMLDDENFDDRVFYNIYKQGLDSFQQESYQQIITMFNKSISNIHQKLELDVPLEQLRRHVRLVTARVEHVPPASEIMTRGYARVLRDQYRRFRKIKSPMTPALLPLHDMVNHSNRPNCAVRVGASPVLGGQPAMTCIALVDIEGGQELCRHYNMAMDRAACLFRFGFLPFDLMTIQEHDYWLKHVKEDVYENNNINPLSREQRLKEAKIRKEAERLEKVFQASRNRANNPNANPFETEAPTRNPGMKDEVPPAGEDDEFTYGDPLKDPSATVGASMYPQANRMPPGGPMNMPPGPMKMPPPPGRAQGR